MIIFVTTKIRGLLYKLLYKPYYKAILGFLGDKTFIPSSTKLEKPENIQIGSNVYIGRMTWLAANPLTGKGKCTLNIGNGTYIGNFAHVYCTSNITIGNKVLFADRVYISDNLHSYKDIETPIIDQSIQQIDEVCIGDGAWVGENACIIGASVGKNSTIGANSVVLKSIPDYCVAVGTPAKIVKRYSFEQKAWLSTDADGNFIII